MTGHEEAARVLLQKLDAARDMPPQVLASCACAHAVLALVETIRAAAHTQPEGGGGGG